MSANVNGIDVDAGPWPSTEVATVRELLRQHAVSIGLLTAETTDDGEIASRKNSNPMSRS